MLKVIRLSLLCLALSGCAFEERIPPAEPFRAPPPVVREPARRLDDFRSVRVREGARWHPLGYVEDWSVPGRGDVREHRIYDSRMRPIGFITADGLAVRYERDRDGGWAGREVRIGEYPFDRGIRRVFGLPKTADLRFVDEGEAAIERRRRAREAGGGRIPGEAPGDLPEGEGGEE